MTLLEIQNHVMFQTNNDADDLPDYQPAVNKYINEGYELLAYAYDKLHLDEVAEGESIARYATLANTTDVPAIPAWAHRAIADYATYLMYRNGNALKQNRGMAYYQMFMEVYKQMPFAKGTVRKMKNLYVEV